MEKMVKNLEKEKDRQLERLQAEIKKRREKKEKKRRKELEEEEARATEADEQEAKSQVLKVEQEQASQLQQSLAQAARPTTPVVLHKSLPKPTANIHDQLASNAKASIPLDVPISEFDLSKLIMSTPLFGQLSEIEMLLKTPLENSESSIARSQHGTSIGTPYIDLKDAQWECKGELVTVDIQSLRPSDFVIYRFGIFATRMLHQHNKLPQVTVLLASNLPPNNYTSNCFRNSFYYEHTKNILFLRKERLESVGEFVMVIMHCLCHIKAGDMANDSDPIFLREFYQVAEIIANINSMCCIVLLPSDNMIECILFCCYVQSQAIKMVCQDLFFAHVKESHSDQVSGYSGDRSYEQIIDDLISTRLNSSESKDTTDGVRFASIRYTCRGFCGGIPCCCINVFHSLNVTSSMFKRISTCNGQLIHNYRVLNTEARCIVLSSLTVNHTKS